jgi:hypothetical protein
MLKTSCPGKTGFPAETIKKKNTTTSSQSTIQTTCGTESSMQGADT